MADFRDTAGARNATDDLAGLGTHLNHLTGHSIGECLADAADRESGAVGNRRDVLSLLNRPRCDQLVTAQRLASRDTVTPSVPIVRAR